ncbi:site-specific integrase [Paraburkholderia sp. CNPSo 3274]|uniref:site-specific integrase n=1 Tax=Paraburkholderia sp. CNPSo 3274 TaxID=2940932 RepID=UPI0020B6CBF0|nr:site-specific integrase [Paraburkholderia sp. CNPSo 3274]MCP3709956.1 site-specific integrase [Paraburkholderia sp. CNPSo 3274]
MGQHIIRRGAAYHYRRVVPEAIRNIIGKREITKSLNTKDRREAEKAARKYGVQVDELFEQAAASLERVRTSGTVDLDTMLDHEHGQDDHELEPYTEADRIEALLDDKPTPVGPNDPAAIAFAAATQNARASLPRPRNAKAAEANNHTFMDALVHWKTTRKPGGAAVAQAHRSLSKFWEISGKRLLPVEVTRAHVAQFVRKLAESGMAPGTVRHYVTFVKALLSAAVDAGYIDSNQALKIATPPASDQRAARLPFTVDEVQTVLKASAGFTGFKYWAPRIAIYTGMRLEEIGQLAPGDIRVEQGCALVYVTDEGDGQHVKTAGSVRRIPLHPELLPLVEIARQATGDRIWPMKANAHGRCTGTFSGKWNKWLRTLGITDKRKAFHSFRHLFKDQLREQGVTEEVSDALTGHAGGNRISRGYGAQFYPVKPLRAAIDKLPAM